jgi:hypothetical protein
MMTEAQEARKAKRRLRVARGETEKGGGHVERAGDARPAEPRVGE